MRAAPKLWPPNLPGTQRSFVSLKVALLQLVAAHVFVGHLLGLAAPAPVASAHSQTSLLHALRRRRHRS